MIGNAREFEGCYFLEDGDNSINLSSTCLNTVLVDNKNMLWHNRLGHPSFHYLQLLLPQLFMNKSASSFECEICEMAKHRRSSFSSKNIMQQNLLS